MILWSFYPSSSEPCVIAFRPEEYFPWPSHAKADSHRHWDWAANSATAKFSQQQRNQVNYRRECFFFLPSVFSVGPCALEYTKMKTADHFWTDPSADELVQRHRIHSGHCRQDSPTKRPALCVSTNKWWISRLPEAATQYVMFSCGRTVRIFHNVR